jgi:hypothetical protein
MDSDGYKCLNMIMPFTHEAGLSQDFISQEEALRLLRLITPMNRLIVRMISSLSERESESLVNLG